MSLFHSPQDHLIITDASPDDAAGIQYVQRETWLATYPNPERGITREDIAAKVAEFQQGGIERFTKRLQEDPTTHHWVAKNGDKVTGFIRVQKSDPRNHLRALYILPEYQGQGIGRKLMEKALTWLGTEKEITLEVVTYNQQAIQFYQHFGFVEGKETTNEAAHLPSGTLLPEIEMIRPAQ